MPKSGIWWGPNIHLAKHEDQLAASQIWDAKKSQDAFTDLMDFVLIEKGGTQS